MLAAGKIATDSRGQNWTVHERTGQGTCCEVYRATSANHREAALKIYKEGLNFELAHDCEAMLLKLVEKNRGICPQLVETLDDFDHGSHCCLLQELLGLNVREIIASNQNHALSLHLSLKMLKDILTGLNALHKTGFVHGDLKPTNLLWGEDSGCLKIIDFSLSFHVEDQTVGRIQSLGYRSPEVDQWNSKQLNKTETKDEQKLNSQNVHSLANFAASPSHVCNNEIIKPRKSADMWSVGCVLAEMLSGRKLFTSENIKSIKATRLKTGESGAALITSHLTQHLSQHLNTVNEQQTDSLHNQLTAFILRCLELDPTKRVTCKEALEDPIFHHNTLASHKDLILLPSPVLRVINMTQSIDLHDDLALQELQEDVVSGCDCDVLQCVIPHSGPWSGQVFVEFATAKHAKSTFRKWCTQTYNGHSLLLTYFPLDIWRLHFTR